MKKGNIKRRCPLFFVVFAAALRVAPLLLLLDAARIPAAATASAEAQRRRRVLRGHMRRCLHRALARKVRREFQNGRIDAAQNAAALIFVAQIGAVNRLAGYASLHKTFERGKGFTGSDGECARIAAAKRIIDQDKRNLPPVGDQSFLYNARMQVVAVKKGVARGLFHRYVQLHGIGVGEFKGKKTRLGIVHDARHGMLEAGVADQPGFAFRCKKQIYIHRIAFPGYKDHCIGLPVRKANLI